MMEFAVGEAYHVRVSENKFAWKNVVKSMKKELKNRQSDDCEIICGCQEHYELRTCVLEGYPLSRVCHKDIFDQVEERLGDSVTAESFEEFSPRHKRWSIYWYYAVNVFGYMGSKRNELPSCFVAKVRESYPNPVGVTYSGYKRKHAE